MNKIILTSLLIYVDKDTNTTLPIKDKNFLKEMSKSTHIHHLLFVCSNPTGYKKTDYYSEHTKRAFEMSGFTIEHLSVLDSRTDKDIDSLILDADVILLSGGVTATQMQYFNKINLKEKLHMYDDKIIIGQSAGSMNLAYTVYDSPEIEDMDTMPTTYYDGLGFIDINIEPHFDINHAEFVQKVCIPNSFIRPFIALPNGSIIVKDTFGTRLYNTAYAIYDGKIKQINDTDSMRTLPENISDFYTNLDK